MNKQTLMLALAAGVGSLVIAMTVLSILPTVSALRGGLPNNNIQAQILAEEREDRFDDRELEILADDNPNNDKSLAQALESMDNDRGVEDRTQ